MPGTCKTQGSILSVAINQRWWHKNLVGRGRRIKISKSSHLHSKSQATLGYTRFCQKTHTHKRSHIDGTLSSKHPCLPFRHEHGQRGLCWWVPLSGASVWMWPWSQQFTPECQYMGQGKGHLGILLNVAHQQRSFWRFEVPGCLCLPQFKNC